MAIHSIRRVSTSMLLYLQPDDHHELVMDFRHHAYRWDTPLEYFPENPASVKVGTQQIELTMPPPFRLPGEDLDPLLWRIGLAAFPEGRAAWLRPGDRFRLRRQPDLEGLPHTTDQARITKALDKMLLLSTEKLARSVDLPMLEVQQVVNALSLMGAVRRAPASSSAPMDPPPPTSTEALTPVDRLRQRLRLEP
ncbi:MAG: hypothetical protein JWO10_299 [Microbacteriaceae bacterium]|nr:hypothetical protein [Microbacteriaceae bacterium]